MEAFLKRTKRKADSSGDQLSKNCVAEEDSNESTDIKLARLSSAYPTLEQDFLLDVLLAHDGSVSEAIISLRHSAALSSPKKQGGATGYQSSLRSFAQASSTTDVSSQVAKKSKTVTRKGETVHLYDPEDISRHTPCTIIHNFLPAEQANDLLRELAEESKTYEKITFKLFDNVVTSPHTSSFYVGSAEELNRQKYEYVYNGSNLTDVRELTPQLIAVKAKVQEAVNREIQERIRTHYPNGRKLKYQSPRQWQPNAAFVNCYDGPRESVGWHSDQLTYLGPRPVIGSLSLGVAREFRVRRVLPRDRAEEDQTDDDVDANEGQLAIHLPHNSLLVMHADMQEEWKHSIAPATAIDPHPVGGGKRLNITYRDYRPEFHPRFTPRCRCGIATILRVVQRKRENRGRYFWMCYAGNVPGREGCSFFQWAEFDDDGNPVWDTTTATGSAEKEPAKSPENPRLPEDVQATSVAKE